LRPMLRTPRRRISSSIAWRLSRQRCRALLAALWLTGCGGTHAPPLPPSAATRPSTSADRWALQNLVVAGIRPTFRDACRAGPVWAAVDVPAAGAHLDAILDDLSTKPSLPPFDRHVSERRSLRSRIASSFRAFNHGIAIDRGTWCPASFPLDCCESICAP